MARTKVVPFIKGYRRAFQEIVFPVIRSAEETGAKLAESFRTFVNYQLKHREIFTAFNLEIPYRFLILFQWIPAWSNPD